MYKLSPSSIGLFLQCPRCFWLDRKEGVKRPGKIFPSLPNGMDRILKEHFDRFRKKGVLPPELSKAGFKGSLFKDQNLLDEWRNWRTGLNVEMPELDAVIRGAIDDLLVDKDGTTLIPFDFKTKDSAPDEDSSGHYHHQMCIYGLMLERNGHEVARKAYLMFYHPEAVNEEGLVMFNASLVETKIDPKDAEELIVNAVKILNKPIPKEDSDCEFCKVRGD